MPKPLPPKTNWTALEIRDGSKSEPDARCAFCNRHIRWLHVIEHAGYPVPKIVGCCCAQRLCRDYDAAGVEREYKNRESRRSRFVDRSKWNISKSNSANIWREVRTKECGKVRVIIFAKGSAYGILCAGPGKDNSVTWPYFFPTQERAVFESFDVVADF